MSTSGLELPHERERQLVQALRGLEGRATLGDVVRATGLPRAQTEQDLRALLGVYHSHLAVDEEGELLYLFDPSLTRRVPEGGLATFLRSAWRWTKSAAVVTLKVGIMALLVFYVIAFLVLIIAALVALASAGGDSDVDLDVGDGLGEGCFSGVIDAMWFWDAGDVLYVPIILHDTHYSYDTYSQSAHQGLPQALREPGALEPRYVTSRYQRKRSRKKRFHEEVFAFIFGPQVPDPAPMPEEREVLAWIHEHKGIITLGELISRTGMSVDQAEQEMARLLSRYEGDVEVSPEGVLLYTFHNLKVTAQTQGKLKAEARPAPPSWHRFEPRAQLTGNGVGKNMLIGGMAAFTLVMSVVAPLVASSMQISLGLGGAAFLSGIPLAMSLLFFVGPLWRVFGHFSENGRRYDRNLRRAVLLTLFEHLSQRSSPLGRRQALESAQRHLLELEELLGEDERQMKKLAKVSDSALGKVLDTVAAELEADVEADDSGELVYAFPRLREELQVADRARRGARASVGLGDIVYSSEEDDDPLEDEIGALEAEQSRAELDALLQEQASEAAAPVGAGKKG
jgi:hypothetical protein